MSVLKTISRILTLPIPNKKYRKKARIKFEEILDILFWPEKSKCIRGFKKECAYNMSLPRENFHIISLGTNCFVRMTLNLWELKPRKAEGEKTMPFDLSIHPLDRVIHILKSDFKGYFDNIDYDTANNYWVNNISQIKYVHDHETDKQIFIERFSRRIENFRAALSDDIPCLFICHVMGDVEAQKANELYDIIAQSCSHKKFKLMFAVFNGSLENCNENIKIYARNFPYKNYSYMDKKVKFTKEGYNFEYDFMKTCRDELLKLLEN